MLRAILNKSWRQHPIRHQLYGHLPPITKNIQARRTRHAGHCWRSREELIGDVLPWAPYMAGQRQDDQLEHTSSSYVRILDVALKTSQRRWTIGRGGKRGSGISVPVARHDDDDEIQPVLPMQEQFHQSHQLAWQNADCFKHYCLTEPMFKFIYIHIYIYIYINEHTFMHISEHTFIYIDIYIYI